MIKCIIINIIYYHIKVYLIKSIFAVPTYNSSSCFSEACSIEFPEMFILTGGVYTEKTVSRYTTSGWMENLPELNEGRFLHGCGYFFNDDMQRVSIRHSNKKNSLIKHGLLIMAKSKNMYFYKTYLFLSGVSCCWGLL